MKHIYVVRYWNNKVHDYFTSYCYFTSMKDAARWAMRHHREREDFENWKIDELEKLDSILKYTF